MNQQSLFRSWRIAGIIAAVAIGWCTTARADMAEQGRALREKLGDAVVTVKVVMNMGGQDGNEVEAEGLGTIISGDGLVVTPLYVIDPEAMAQRVMGPSAAMFGIGGTQVKSIKIVIGKRQEVDATVVLRDVDLNVAFLRPRVKPEKPMVHVDLKQAGQVRVFDPFITLVRLGNVADREVGVLSGRIQAIISKPRMYYMPSGGFAGFGVPAFTEQGQVLGICLVRISAAGPDEMSNGIFSMNLSHMGLVPVILPAADVLEIAAQAPKEAAPTPEPSPAKAPDSATTGTQAGEAPAGTE